MEGYRGAQSLEEEWELLVRDALEEGEDGQTPDEALQELRRELDRISLAAGVRTRLCRSLLASPWLAERHCLLVEVAPELDLSMC